MTVSRIVMSKDPQDLQPKGSLYTFALISIGIESEKWIEVIANNWIRQQHDVSTCRFMVTSELMGVGRGEFDVPGPGLKSSALV